jgi:hypothetical protein
MIFVSILVIHMYRVSQNSRIPKSERGREGPSSKSAPSDHFFFVGGSPDFFYFHIWTTEVIPYNALNSEFANFETPCIKILTNRDEINFFFQHFLTQDIFNAFTKCCPFFNKKVSNVGANSSNKNLRRNVTRRRCYSRGRSQVFKQLDGGSCQPLFDTTPSAPAPIVKHSCAAESQPSAIKLLCRGGEAWRSH